MQIKVHDRSKWDFNLEDGDVFLGEEPTTPHRIIRIRLANGDLYTFGRHFSEIVTVYTPLGQQIRYRGDGTYYILEDDPTNIWGKQVEYDTTDPKSATVGTETGL